LFQIFQLVLQCQTIFLWCINHINWLLYSIINIQNSLLFYFIRFLEKFNIPHTIGAVDGTQIAITPPNEIDELYPENLYINRKQYHSINCQIVSNLSMQTNMYPNLENC